MRTYIVLMQDAPIPLGFKMRSIDKDGNPYFMEAHHANFRTVDYVQFPDDMSPEDMIERAKRLTGVAHPILSPLPEYKP